jgi:hypothetical protein
LIQKEIKFRKTCDSPEDVRKIVEK